MKKFAVLLLLLFLISQLSSLISSATAQTLPPEERNLSVSATVPPTVSDFQFSMTSPVGQNVVQNQVIPFVINYGASSSAALSTTTTITVDFSQDQAQDGTHVVDYVIGSATNGYDNSKPIVNLTRRTITWTINLPVDTLGQALRFELRTNENYRANKIVNFNVYADMSNQYVTMPQQLRTFTYLFDPTRVTPEPTVYVTPTTTPIPTPTPAPPALRITDVEFKSITDNSATVTVTTNRPSRKLIQYGTSPQSLTNREQTTSYQVTSDLVLKDLKPDTDYYFWIRAVDIAGVNRYSELFTFRTAKESLLPDLSNNGVVIATGGTVILSEILTPGRMPFGLLSTNTTYQLLYTFNQTVGVTNAEVIIRDSNGVDQTVALQSDGGRTYRAEFRTDGNGNYSIFIRLTDANGNIVEQQVARFKALSYLTVKDKGSNLPIADARVVITSFNPRKQTYEPLPSISKPLFSTANGEIILMLPPGKYKAEGSAFGYAPGSVEFTLGDKTGQEFPTLYLTRDFFNLSALFTFLLHWLTDTFNLLWLWLMELSTSSRFYGIIAGTIVGSFALLTSLFFTYRTGIRWRDLVPYFLFHLFILAKKHKEAYIYGIVLGPDGQPVSQARIEVLDMKSTEVLTHTMTNKSGRFMIRNLFKQQNIKLIISREGYIETEHIVPTDDDKTLKLRMDFKHESANAGVRGLRHIGGEFFELVLLLSLIAELVFLLTFGITKTLPFFLLSVFNLLMWIFFERERKFE